jgi:DNA-binding transcriptional LysR family regulator
MDFDRLRALVWAIDEGGISAAARRLNRTQPAVTRMLQTLEEQVGAELIDRRSRPLKPTAIGGRVLEHARDILQFADRLTDGSVRTTRQMLRLGVSRSLLWHLRDAGFLNAPPPLRDTDFVVRSGWSPRLYRRFARGEFDSAILLMPPTWKPDVPCRAQVIGREALAVISPRPPNGPPRVRVDLSDLPNRSWVLNPDGCGFRHALTRSLAEGGYRLHVQFELDAAPQEHLSMVAAGVGCSIVPSSALEQGARDAKKVQRLIIKNFDGALGVWMLWADRHKPTAGTPEALAAIFCRPQRR